MKEQPFWRTLEELAEAEERLMFLTVQRQDIVEGIAATEEALREIKRRSRERFRHARIWLDQPFEVRSLEGPVGLEHRLPRLVRIRHARPDGVVAEDRIERSYQNRAP